MHGIWLWWAYYLLHRIVGVAIAVLVAWVVRDFLRRHWR